MSAWGLLRSKVRKSVTEAYIDLTLVGLLTLTTIGVTLLPIVRETPVRPIVGITFVLIAPGWAVVAALYPRGSRLIDTDDLPSDLPFSGSELDELIKTADRDSEGTEPIERRLSGVERLALSLGVGAALVVIVGISINYTPWPIALGPVIVTLSVSTLLCTLIGAIRRSNVFPFDRFRVPLGAVRNAFGGTPTFGDHVLNVALVLSILLLIGTLGFTLTTPAPDDRYTNFWVLTEDDDGDFLAENYTAALEEDSDRELVIGVENNENEAVLYSVVVQFQEIQQDGDNTDIVDRQELERFEEHIDAGQQWTHPHELTPPDSGDEFRVQYLLYKTEAPYTETVPEEPTAENADHDIHIWTQSDE